LYLVKTKLFKIVFSNGGLFSFYMLERKFFIYVRVGRTEKTFLMRLLHEGGELSRR